MFPCGGMGGMGMPQMQMGMGMPMAMPMGMPMAMPMGVGMQAMPMMGMMGVPAGMGVQAMPMMTPMMAPMTGAGMQQMQPQMPSQTSSSQPMQPAELQQKLEMQLQQAQQQQKMQQQHQQMQQQQQQQLQQMQQQMQQQMLQQQQLQQQPKDSAAASSSAPPAPPPPALSGSGADAGRTDSRQDATSPALLPALAAARKAVEEQELERKKGERERTGSAVESEQAEEQEAPPVVQETPRCHLHSAKKPNAKCKFCIRAQESLAAAEKASQAASQAASSAAAEEAGGNDEDYSKRTFNCSPMLKDQIFGSMYFKSTLELTVLEDLIEEIGKYADTLSVYNAGSTSSPSCLIAQVYRLFTLPQAEDLGEIQALVDYPDHPMVRVAGFLYMRFVVPPAKLWNKFEEYLFDEMEIKLDGPKHGMGTIGEYVENLLVRDKYFGTPLPRIPVKVRQMLECELAPLDQYRKRMQANLKNFPVTRRIPSLPVEVFVDGEWVSGEAKEFVGRSSLRRRVKVRLENGQTVTSHLGKVVLRDPPEQDPASGDEEAAEGGKRHRSRSPSSLDWSRYKGDADGEHLLKQLRARAKEDAVCSAGQSYSRRPYSVEEELWKRDPDSRVSMLGDRDERSGGHGSSSSHRRPNVDRDAPAEVSEATRKRRQEEEEARKKLMRNIMEKYGSSQASSTPKPAASHLDVEQVDVLRLG